METLKNQPELGMFNAFMAGHELPAEPQTTTESSQPVSEKPGGKIDIPEEMLPFASVLHGLA